MDSQLDHGNWVRRRKLLTLGLCAVAIGALIRAPLGFVYRAAMSVLFVFVSVSFLVPLYAYVIFARQGGRFQDRVYALIIQCLGASVNGTILDIGSGNGVLAVRLAQQMDSAEVVGVGPAYLLSLRIPDPSESGKV